MTELETCIKFGEHGARVKIEDKEIPHYASHVDQAKKEVSCWIPSEEGKAFTVVWLGLDVDYPSAGNLYLDGHFAGCMYRQIQNPIIFRHGVVSNSSLAPFIFTPLVVTDDDTYLDTSPASIGEIKFDIFRTTVPKKKGKTQNSTLPGLPHSEKVHERSKKATAHRVNYGAEISRQPSDDTAKIVERLVTFIFRYQPLEMLRANDIVPRNPEHLEPQKSGFDAVSPPKSETSSGKGKDFNVKKEVESGLEIDDKDSIKEKALLAEAERCQAEAERYQAEAERIRKGRHFKLEDSELERPKKKLKMEDKPYSGFKFIPGEIIDLTW